MCLWKRGCESTIKHLYYLVSSLCRGQEGNVVYRGIPHNINFESVPYLIMECAWNTCWCVTLQSTVENIEKETETEADMRQKVQMRAKSTDSTFGQSTAGCTVHVLSVGTEKVGRLPSPLITRNDSNGPKTYLWNQIHLHTRTENPHKNTQAEEGGDRIGERRM